MGMDSADRVVARDKRVIIVSLPKSGTYLMGEVLKSLGYRWTGMHLAEAGYTDYSEADLHEARRNPGRFRRNEPLDVSLNRIGSGDFAVGHLPCNQNVRRATSGFKRLYLTRDLRLALISYMRFLRTTGRNNAERLSWYSIPDIRRRLVEFLSTSAPLLLQQLYRGMVGWSDVDGVARVRFEDLTDGSERSAQTVASVADFLGIEDCDVQSVLESSLGAETITKSTGLTRLKDYWSREAEKRFQQIGGRELNARLGAAAEESVKPLV